MLTLSTLGTLIAGALIASDGAPPERPTLRLGGLIQPELIVALSDADAAVTDEFRFRRLRTMVGASWGQVSFRIVPEFAGGRVRGQDVYMDIVLWKDASDSLTLRVGKDKPPLSVDLWQSSTAMSFLERGPSSQLVPDRDTGAMLTLKWQWLEAQVMVANGGPDLTSNDTVVGEDFEVYVRLGVRAGPAVVAVTGSYGDAAETAIPNYRSVGRRPALESTTPLESPSDEARRRLGASARVEAGPVHGWVEALVSDHIVSVGAWQAGLSVIVTETDQNPFNRLNPAGDVEIAARVGQFTTEPLERAGEDGRQGYWNAGLSATWSIDSRLKLVAGYEYTTWSGHATPRSDEHLLGVRLQAYAYESL